MNASENEIKRNSKNECPKIKEAYFFLIYKCRDKIIQTNNFIANYFKSNLSNLTS